MKRFINKLTGSEEDQDLEFDDQAAQQLEAARREAMGQQGGPPPSGPPGFGAASSPTPAQPPGGGGPSMAPNQFAAPGAAGSGLTPDSERQEITGMALEQLQERRRAPTEGVQLEGVPSPEIPSEVLRDQALNEILQRKERLDEEYRRSRGGSSTPRRTSKGKPSPFKKLKKPAEDEPEARTAPAKGPGKAPEEAPPQAPQQASHQAPPPGPRTAPKKGPKKKIKLRPLKSVSSPAPKAEEAAPAEAPAPKADEAAEAEAPAPAEEVVPAPASAVVDEPATTGQDAEEALASIKGVGPVTRQALLERFSSLEGVKQADVAELTEVPGIGPALAGRIKSSL